MSTGTLERIAPPAYAQVDEEREVFLKQEIRRLASARNALILAHNYQLPEVQDVADFVGDSLGLALEAQKDPRETIVFCGVHFMAESAKILNPGKKVLLPSLAAGCSLSDSITADSLEDWKQRYPGRAVVTYVNSSAEVKAQSDICCTSANAVSVIRSLSQEKILFTPDRNLGRWVARQVPEKDIVVYAPSTASSSSTTSTWARTPSPTTTSPIRRTSSRSSTRCCRTRTASSSPTWRPWAARRRATPATPRRRPPIRSSPPRPTSAASIRRTRGPGSPGSAMPTIETARQRNQG
ncbi:MAG: quinolinate synthase NadA, partial [Acidobacteria bacterium]|nr:quinolinate synthase NadA [Acidobacteriota bacterium]